MNYESEDFERFSITYNSTNVNTTAELSELSGIGAYLQQEQNWQINKTAEVQLRQFLQR